MGVLLLTFLISTFSCMAGHSKILLFVVVFLYSSRISLMPLASEKVKKISFKMLLLCLPVKLVKMKKSNK